MPLGALIPLAPMKGDDPEVIAANEFFVGRGSTEGQPNARPLDDRALR